MSFNVLSSLHFYRSCAHQEASGRLRPFAVPPHFPLGKAELFSLGAAPPPPPPPTGLLWCLNCCGRRRATFSLFSSLVLKHTPLDAQICTYMHMHTYACTGPSTRITLTVTFVWHLLYAMDQCQDFKQIISTSSQPPHKIGPVTFLGLQSL